MRLYQRRGYLWGKLTHSLTARFLICPSVGLDQRSYSLSGQVGTGMGDHFLGGQTTSLCSQPPMVNSAWPSSLGRCNEYWRWFWPLRGKKVDTVIRTARHKLKWQPSCMYHLLIDCNYNNGSSTVCGPDF